MTLERENLELRRTLARTQIAVLQYQERDLTAALAAMATEEAQEAAPPVAATKTAPRRKHGSE